MKPSPWHRLNHGGSSTLPPHPATVVQPKAPHPAAVVQEKALPPHPATVVQPKAPHPAMVAQPKTLPPHPATVVQPKRPFGASPAPSPRSATTAGNGWARLVQRAQAPLVELAKGGDQAGVKFLKSAEWEKNTGTAKKPKIVKIRAYVYLVAPGIAVETDNEEDLSFPTFIAKTIAEMGGVPVGRHLVGEFDPKNGFVQLAEDPYKGITLLVSEMKSGAPLQTVSFVSRPGGAFRAGDDKWKCIPRIVFPNRPGPDKSLDVGKTATKVTQSGIVDHPDFEGQTVPFHLVLFHELCHAYYFQIGLSPEYYAVPQLDAYADSGNTLEEMLVCGLRFGRGLEYCENNYRVQNELPLRTTYKAVQLEDAQVHADDWNRNEYVHPLAVMARANVPKVQIRTKGTGRWEQFQGQN